MNKRKKSLPSRILPHLILILIGISFFLPFFWMVSTSLKLNSQVYSLPPKWIPNPFVWNNYPKALTYIPFFLYFRNTLYVALFNVAASVVSCSLVAYGFSRVQWPGRDFMFGVLLATLMIPYPVTIIPTFIVFKWLGWLGTFKPLTIPALFGTPFYIFLLRQFYMTIPQELSDAARIDGANDFGIFTRVILPLAKPALATVSLFTFLANWNDFLGPLIYLNNKETYTLAIGLYGFSGRTTQMAMLMAATTVTVIPVVILFFFTQRTFIQGITLTGIKG
jgi:multiple sugar transport system permease protein